jgi:hypothetical protein
VTSDPETVERVIYLIERRLHRPASAPRRER